MFNDQIELHMLQLGRFSLPETLDAEAEWVYFLKEARRWTELPATLHSPALRKAMNQLKTISQSQKDLALYRAREDYQRWELTKERERQQLDEELAAAREALEVAERERQEALAREAQAERERQEALAREAQAERERQEALMREAQAERERQEALMREAQAEREHKRLRQRLRAAGIDPDA